MASERRLVDANVLEEMVKISDKPAWMVVRDAPTVDAVEVVPCKECKHRGHILRCPMCFEEQYEFDEGDGYMCTDYRTYDRTKDNGYCDRGERKDNERKAD